MQTFFALIDRLNAGAESERRELEAAIWGEFGVEKAILALDMSHFSLTVRRSGILPYLALIRRMQLLTAPIVARHGGAVVKYAADNLMAVFDQVADAVEAAVAIQEAIAAGAEGFTVAIGIDHGRFILIPGDCYGDAINVACKLGEDLAHPGEVLVTGAARGRLDPAFRHRLSAQHVSVSGLDIPAYSVRIGNETNEDVNP